MSKKTKTQPVSGKRTEQPLLSTDNDKQVWIFDSVDRDGPFDFTPNRIDMDCEDILDKIIYYSGRTWNDIKRETHDSGKTKHHHLSYNTLSESAINRIKKLHLGDQTDSIFQMRLDNMVRIIGLREGRNFIVKWFDSNHEFSPVSK